MPTRAYAKVPFGTSKRLSVPGAISHDGILAAMSVEAAATDGATSATYLGQALLVLHQRRPDAVLVMDNLQSSGASRG
ncbi:MAG: hypothetical protein ACJ8AI_27100 [Rhodopila sp.]